MILHFMAIIMQTVTPDKTLFFISFLFLCENIRCGAPLELSGVWVGGVGGGWE